MWLACACSAQAATPMDEHAIKVAVPAGFVARASLPLDRMAGEIFSAVSANDEHIAFRVMRVGHERADINQIIETLQQRLLENTRLRSVTLTNIERIETQDTIAWAWTATYRAVDAANSLRQARYVFLEGQRETLVLQMQGPQAWMQVHQAQLLSFVSLIEGFEPDAQQEAPFELVRLNPAP
jgi:hypothetical protein